MQRASQDQLSAMVGVEYQLLFVQPNILFVVRKQQRSSPSHVTPIADFYIINGHIYQAPDLSNVLSSRLLTAVTNLQSAFDEARGYAKYHPSRGYWWDFDEDKTKSGKLNKKPKGDQQGGSKGEGRSKTKKSKKKGTDADQAAQGINSASSLFQRRRVDMLLDFWVRKFPPTIATAPSGPQTAAAVGASNPPSQAGAGEKGDDARSEVKSEKPSEQASNAGLEAPVRGVKRV